MRAVVQRVSEAKVVVDGKTAGSIGEGLLVLAGFHAADLESDLQKMAGKIARLRIFSDPEGKMQKSVQDIGGEILAISQFTLYADLRKGNRPSFSEAAPPAQAAAQYELFCIYLQALIGKPIQCGIFAADMKVSLLNDGPVTIVMDSSTWSKE